jgi:hypothetical protein
MDCSDSCEIVQTQPINVQRRITTFKVYKNLLVFFSNIMGVLQVLSINTIAGTSDFFCGGIVSGINVLPTEIVVYTSGQTLNFSTGKYNNKACDFARDLEEFQRNEISVTGVEGVHMINNTTGQMEITNCQVTCYNGAMIIISDDDVKCIAVDNSSIPLTLRNTDVENVQIKRNGKIHINMGMIRITFHIRSSGFEIGISDIIKMINDIDHLPESTISATTLVNTTVTVSNTEKTRSPVPTPVIANNAWARSANINCVSKVSETTTTPIPVAVCKPVTENFQNHPTVVLFNEILKSKLATLWQFDTSNASNSERKKILADLDTRVNDIVGRFIGALSSSISQNFEYGSVSYGTIKEWFQRQKVDICIGRFLASIYTHESRFWRENDEICFSLNEFENYDVQHD